MKKIFYPGLIVSLSLFMFSCKHSKSNNTPTGDTPTPVGVPTPDDPIDPVTDPAPIVVNPSNPDTPAPAKLTIGSFFKSECQKSISAVQSGPGDLFIFAFNQSDCLTIPEGFARRENRINVGDSVCGPFTANSFAMSNTYSKVAQVLVNNKSTSDFFILDVDDTPVEITDCTALKKYTFTKTSLLGNEKIRDLIDEKCIPYATLKVRNSSEGSTVANHDEFYIYFDPTQLPKSLKDKCWKYATFVPNTLNAFYCSSAFQMNEMYLLSYSFIQGTTIERVLDSIALNDGHFHVTKCSGGTIWNYKK